MSYYSGCYFYGVFFVVRQRKSTPDNIENPCNCIAQRWKVMDKFTSLGLANLSVEFLGLKAATDDDRDSRHRVGPDSCKLKCVLYCLTFMAPYVMITTTENYKNFFVDDSITEVEFLSKTFFHCHDVVEGNLVLKSFITQSDIQEFPENLLQEYLDIMFPIDVELAYPVTVTVISMNHGDNIIDSCSCTRSRWKIMDKFKELGLENLSVEYLGLEAATENQGFGHRHTVHPEINPSFLRNINVFPTVMITSTENWERMGE